MPTTAPSLPVPPNVVVEDIFRFFDSIVTGFIPVPSYAIECLSVFDRMIDSSFHDVFVWVIRVCTDPVSVDLVNVYVLSLGLMSFAETVFCSLNNSVLFVSSTPTVVRNINSASFFRVDSSLLVLVLLCTTSSSTETVFGQAFKIMYRFLSMVLAFRDGSLTFVNDSDAFVSP